MIALVVLFSLLASHVDSQNDYKEIEFMQDLQTAMESLTKRDSNVPAAATITTDTLFNIMKSSHRNVLARQAECEAKIEDHDWWKRKAITNKTAELIKLMGARKRLRLDCENATTITLPHHHCVCDNSSSYNYCGILSANHSMIFYKIRAKEEIEENVPCNNELWRDIKPINRWYKHNLSEGLESTMAQNYSNYTTNKEDMGQDIQLAYRNNASEIEAYLHNIMRKLRYVDIRFRIAEDLLKMKFLSMVSFDFCNQDYLLSKCMCDELSVASFCMRYFYKQAALVFVNETLCDNYSPESTSAAPTSSFLSITIIFLFSSLRF